MPVDPLGRLGNLSHEVGDTPGRDDDSFTQALNQRLGPPPGPGSSTGYGPVRPSTLRLPSRLASGTMPGRLTMRTVLPWADSSGPGAVGPAQGFRPAPAAPESSGPYAGRSSSDPRREAPRPVPGGSGGYGQSGRFLRVEAEETRHRVVATDLRTGERIYGEEITIRPPGGGPYRQRTASTSPFPPGPRGTGAYEASLSTGAPPPLDASMSMTESSRGGHRPPQPDRPTFSRELLAAGDQIGGHASAAYNSHVLREKQRKALEQQSLLQASQPPRWPTPAWVNQPITGNSGDLSVAASGMQSDARVIRRQFNAMQPEQQPGSNADGLGGLTENFARLPSPSGSGSLSPYHPPGAAGKRRAQLTPPGAGPSQRTRPGTPPSEDPPSGSDDEDLQHALEASAAERRPQNDLASFQTPGAGSSRSSALDRFAAAQDRSRAADVPPIRRAGGSGDDQSINLRDEGVGAGPVRGNQDAEPFMIRWGERGCDVVEIRKKVGALTASGKTPAEIQDQTGVPFSTFKNWPEYKTGRQQIAPPRPSQELLDRVQQMAAEGKILREINEETKIPASTIYRMKGYQSGRDQRKKTQR
jgi:hypothetical protein